MVAPSSSTGPTPRLAVERICHHAVVGTGALVVFVVAVSVEGAACVVLAALWLRGRRRQRVLEGDLAQALEGTGRKPRARRLVPTPDEAVKAVWETVDRVREKGLGGAIRSSIDDLAGWAQVERPALVQLAGPDGSVAIFFSDIQGSTELNERLGDREWVRLLARHDAAVRSAIQRYGGHVVKTQGDGFMAAFGTPEQAVRSAIAVQQAFERGRADGRAAVLIRIGIHHGDVVHRDNDIFGRNVAQAARVAALADGGEILVSDAVAEAVADRDDLSLAEPREVRLKGLTGVHRVAAVEWA
jgi:adenylate cyclase